jgi:Tfp pilus assembly protein PilV
MIHSRSKKNGFSFIELLVASVIIFSLIMGTAQLTIHSMLIKKWSDHRMNAATIISSQLEQLKSQFFSTSECQEGSYDASVKGQAGNQPFRLEWTIQSIPVGMKSIELRCFPESSPHRETRLLVYLSDELGF